MIDFMETAESTTALAAMMDDRSNPETYQVSNVADWALYRIALKEIYLARRQLYRWNKALNT